MPMGFLLRGSSWKRIWMKSPVSSIWLVAWANLDSSRSTGGSAESPGTKKTRQIKMRKKYSGSVEREGGQIKVAADKREAGMVSCSLLPASCSSRERSDCSMLPALCYEKIIAGKAPGVYRGLNPTLVSPG